MNMNKDQIRAIQNVFDQASNWVEDWKRERISEDAQRIADCEEDLQQEEALLGFIQRATRIEEAARNLLTLWGRTNDRRDFDLGPLRRALSTEADHTISNFIRAYKNQLVTSYTWACDEVRRDKFIQSVARTLAGMNTWNHDGSCVVNAWLDIGKTGKPSLKKLRELTDLCPICGEKITLKGVTTNDLLIGSCGDSFWLHRLMENKD
jgi:hypothetical protein